MLDQDVARADFSKRGRLQERRPGERVDLFLREALRRLPHRLLRHGVVEIRHSARIREANFPAGLRTNESKKKKLLSTPPPLKL